MSYNLPHKPFKSDGCSGGLSKYWKKLFGKAPDFEICCYLHDIEYHYGSGENASHWTKFKERLWVDNEFFKCLWGYSLLGKLLSVPIWLAVRLGGGEYMNKPYSWGFGWNKK